MALSTTPTTQSLYTAPPIEPSPLALDFRDSLGRVWGFPYGHLLNYQLDKNPNAELHAATPPDRLSLSFSTHDVLLLGWRLSKVLDPLDRARIASLIARLPRYANLEKEKAFIAEIIVKPAQKD